MQVRAESTFMLMYANEWTRAILDEQCIWVYAVLIISVCVCVCVCARVCVCVHICAQQVCIVL